MVHYKNENAIPVTKHGWFDYKDQVFLIRIDNDGNVANFQSDGVKCKQSAVQGFVAVKFTSTNKYFRSSFWYKKTGWGSEYPKKIYFDTKKLIRMFDSLHDGRKAISNKRWEAFWKKLDAEADKYARPSENILKSIIREACHKTGMKLRFAFPETEYDQYWVEAYVPLKDDKDVLYILTWENCD